MRKFILLFFSLIFVTIVSAQTGKDLVKVTDLLKIKSIGSVDLSPDGRQAAFTVTSIEPDGESKLDYKYVTQIYLVPSDGSSKPRPITTKENSTQPTWSPDGKTIAFVRGADGKPQIFLLPLDGGEAIQLTKFKYGASNPRWSPDGKKILFTAGVALKDLMRDSVVNGGNNVPEWQFEKPGYNDNSFLKENSATPNPDGNMAEIRAYLDRDVADKKARVINKLNFQDEMNISSDMSFSHQYVVDATPNATPIPVNTGYFDFNANFTPDGKHLIIVADLDSTEHPDRTRENEIYLADVNGKTLKKILGEKGFSFSNPSVSPNGKWIVYTQSNPTQVSIPVLKMMPLNGSSKDAMAIPFDRSKSSFVWSSDGRFLYFVAQSNGGAPMYRLNIETKKIDQLSGFDEGVGSYDIKGNKLVFVKTSIDAPFELYAADPDMKNSKQISYFNTEWISHKKLSIPQKHTFKNSEGMPVEYWVMKPTNYEEGKKYPLLLEIHGGPSAMWGPGEASMWHEYQFFCSKGYGVVYCNPRGSGGYGEDFLRGNVANWGAGPTSDVLTSLDKAVQEGWGDTSRLLVTGGSYAGYLVAWIIAHDHRFKAACSQRGVYDLATFFGEGNAWRLVPSYFGGYPWEPKVKELLVHESPITYVDQITTPYIIFHGDNDRRTGFVQGEMMYRSLKVLGRPVEYVRHTNATHEITRSGDNRQRIDQMLRTYEFFERWIH